MTVNFWNFYTVGRHFFASNFIFWRCKCFTTFFPFECLLLSYSWLECHSLEVTRCIHYLPKFISRKIWVMAEISKIIPHCLISKLIIFSVPPTRIEIKRGNPFFISEKTYNISCSTVGSNPQPYTRIWHRNSELPVLQTTAISHLESKIIAEFQPDSEDDDSFLICKSENPLITNSAVEDQWKINVKCESTQYFQCCQF